MTESNQAAAAASSVSSAATPVPPARPSWRLIGLSAVFVLVVAAIGYSRTGAPGLWNATAADAERARAEAQAAEQNGGPTAEQINTMVDQLAERLKQQPDDMEGWTMLARSYTVLGRHAEAIPIYQKVLAARGDDATVLADYADSLAMSQGRQLSGEPLALLQRAIKADPVHTKALSLIGTEAFIRKDYQAAVDYWERIVKSGKVQPELAEQVQGGIDEARRLGDMPPSAKVAGATGVGGDVKPQAAAGAGFVAGEITLSAALKDQASPDDTVFIFARAAEGPRMPLAALRRKVRDLPVTFRLDDSMGMTPQMKLSNFPQVVVGARISKSGEPTPQPGDLQGASQPVALGTEGIRVEIGEVVGAR